MATEQRRKEVEYQITGRAPKGLAIVVVKK
jgi:hypothetical protein